MATLLIVLVVAAAAWRGSRVVLSVGRNVEGAVTALSIRINSMEESQATVVRCVSSMEETQAAVVQCVESLNEMAGDEYGSEEEEGSEGGETTSQASGDAAAGGEHPLATSTPRAPASSVDAISGAADATSDSAAAVTSDDATRARGGAMASGGVKKYLRFPLLRPRRKKRGQDNIRMKVIRKQHGDDHGGDDDDDDDEDEDETLK